LEANNNKEERGRGERKQENNATTLNTQLTMSAIFDFSSLLTVMLLLICTCAYLRDMRPTIFDGGKVR
jgi:hypothetical protein